MFSFINIIFAISYGLSLVSSVCALTFGFPYGSQKVRGVNLGGWLVLEPWITPSLFDNTGDSRIVDEYTFAQYQDRTKATNILKNHWNTWITDGDFQAIAAAGLNHIRIPIGYWAFDVSGGEPYIQGQVEYLYKAVDWARKYNLKVIVDLHGAPGSQNGFDNSGQRKAYPLWHTQANNVQRTVAVVKTLANMFKDNTGVVPIIQALNEPAGFQGDDVMKVTKQFWYDSYGNVRWPYGTSQQSNTVLMIHDAFRLDQWKNFMPYPGWDGVIMDTHIYQMFSPEENQMSYSQHIQKACAQKTTLQSSTLWMVVGEWSPAANDCAKYLNGRGIGSRYEGTYPGSTRVDSCFGTTGKASGFSNAYKTFLRQYWEAQIITFEKYGQGWIQWTWKAENADEWSYQAGLANGWIPKSPAQLQFGSICG